MRRAVWILLAIGISLTDTCAVVSLEELRDFIVETNMIVFVGAKTSENRDRRVALMKQLEGMPIETIDTALQLMPNPPPGFDGWHTRVLSFISGMYQTHRISAEQHANVSSAVISQMVFPEGKPGESEDVFVALQFFLDNGSDSDLEKLSVALDHPDPFTREQARVLLHLMATERKLPDPTVSRNASNQNAPSASGTAARNPSESGGAAPTTVAVANGATASGGGFMVPASWIVVAALFTCGGIGVILCMLRRRSDRVA